MNKSDFYFELPKGLIAQTPIENRTSSRMLCLNKTTGEIEHKHFYDLLEFLNEGDCLVINDSKVIPARLMGERETGACVEILLLSQKEKDVWEVLVKPGRKARPNDVIIFGNGLLSCKIESIEEDGKRLARFMYDGIFEEILDTLGEMPLPPYITEKLLDKNRYQTVYAKNAGSAAAPTAGLHFTKDLLKTLVEKGIRVAKVTLHVGLGTFRPVKTENILEHHMHSEFYTVTEEDAKSINDCKQNSKKIIAVGTTSARSLESCADENGFIKAFSGYTDIFIYPGYKFKIVDNMITNFHLPESTLIMLVSALAGKENILSAYNIAVKEKYRFFSFGDAMFIYN